MRFDDAVRKAMRRCVEEGILVEYLTGLRAADGMRVLTEYNKEEEMRRLRYSYREYYGKQGREEALASSIASLMETIGMTADEAMDALGLCENDREALKQAVEEPRR